MLEVRPFFNSCSKLKTFDLAAPRPSSMIPLVRTPTSVLLPLSTFPITAMRTSFSSLTARELDRQSSCSSKPFLSSSSYKWVRFNPSSFFSSSWSSLITVVGSSYDIFIVSRISASVLGVAGCLTSSWDVASGVASIFSNIWYKCL